MKFLLYFLMCLIILNTFSVAQGTIPSRLDILSANIVELDHRKDISNRPLVILIEVAKIANCDSSSTPTSYGILLDVDMSSKTGKNIKEFSDIGADTYISIDCNQNTGVYSSSIGVVSLTKTQKGTTVIKVLTTVGSLPSIQFNWIAFALDGNKFVRTPNAESHGMWTIHELSLY